MGFSDLRIQRSMPIESIELVFDVEGRHHGDFRSSTEIGDRNMH
jgi:hypothetical protein